MTYRDGQWNEPLSDEAKQQLAAMFSHAKIWINSFLSWDRGTDQVLRIDRRTGQVLAAYQFRDEWL
jgi:hypothetical protein